MYREGGAKDWQDQLAGLAGRVDHEWTWGGVGAYLDAVEEAGVAPNVGTLVGHGTVRFNVLGMEDTEPSAEQLSEMRDLVSEAMAEGAFGLSTALVITPCSYATHRDIVAVDDVVDRRATSSHLFPGVVGQPHRFAVSHGPHVSNRETTVERYHTTTVGGGLAVSLARIVSVPRAGAKQIKH